MDAVDACEVAEGEGNKLRNTAIALREKLHAKFARLTATDEPESHIVTKANAVASPPLTAARG